MLKLQLRLDPIRRTIMRQMLLFACLISGLAFFAIYLTYLSHGFVPVMVAQISVLIFTWTLFFTQAKIPTRTLAGILLAMMFLLTTANLTHRGIFANSAFFAVIPAIAFVLLGARAAIALYVASLAVFAGLGVIFTQGILVFPLNSNTLLTNPATWVNQGMVLLVAGGLLLFSLSTVNRHWLKTLAEFDAELAAREKVEERLHLAMQGANDGLWDWDMSSGHVYYSPRWFTMLGYDPDSFAPTLDTWKELVHPDDRDRTLDVVDAYVRDEIPFFNVEFKMRHKDGHWIEVLSRAQLIRTETGGHRLIGTHVDVTRRNELMRQIESAKAESQSKSQFLANMSHEIRTPMNGVLGMAEILSQTDLSDEQRQMLRTIQESADALLSIIDDILDISKIEAGKLKIETTKVVIVDELERICNTVRPLTEHRDVRLHLSMTPQVMGAMECDSTRLRQIVMNLLSNAVKFSSGLPDRRGHVELHVELPKPDEILFRVSDNGIGMSKEFQTALFKPFSQAEIGTTRKYGGTGLGLSIAKNLVDMLGGRIEVESQEGKGTSFSVYLPFKPVPHDMPLPDLSGLNILAHIDEQASCESISEFVASQGSNLTKIDAVDELEVAAEKSPPGTIVFVALHNLEENEAVIEAVSRRNPELYFLSAVTSRLNLMGEQRENCYRIQRFPMLPTDFVRGLTFLSKRGEEPEIDSAASPEVPPDRHSKILLVEDNEINKAVVHRQLTLLGYDVTCASDGLAAYDLWVNGGFDLILTDCHMPKMDGFELSSKIRAEEQSRGQGTIPILALTADALKGTDQRCAAAGMNGYLSKPVKMEHLKATLEKHIDAHTP